MMAAGKITSEDAERLLDKLNAVTELPANNAPENRDGTGPIPARKYLRVVVTGAGKDVNMRVPLNFVRAGVGLIGVLPVDVAQKLGEKGIDLDSLSRLADDKLPGVLNALDIEIDKGSGKHVRIFCE
jgi:hypothetical protein